MLRSTLRPAPRRAFTLIEMLTVIGILAIVMAIVIPAMNSARRTAKMTDTRATLASLQQAVNSFQTDNRKDPGYFGPRLMGAQYNRTTAGFTSMDNIMLDLMGGIVASNATGQGIFAVGPGAPGSGQVMLDLGGFGATRQQGSSIVRNYFVADAKKMVAQDPLKNQRFGSGAVSQSDPTAIVPSLVDAFGQPILAWQQDVAAPAGYTGASTFAEIDAPAANAVTGFAQFYWSQNAGFLDTSIKLGRLGEAQSFAAGGSLLALNNNSAVTPPTNPTTVARTATMWALLGNPAASDLSDTSANGRPAAARGPIVFHSAGPDGVFVGNRDRGGASGVVVYKKNQDPFNGVLFDDQIMGAGN